MDHEEKKTKPRAKTGALRSKRPQSAPNKRVRTPPVHNNNNNIVPLGEYSKSLKLIGVDVESTRKEATKLTNQPVVVETKTPTLQTRLTRRSESHADLTQTVKPGINRLQFQAIKQNLNAAVFEEWYFKKFTEAKEAKLKKELELQRAQKEEQEKRKDIEERSKEEFELWLSKKKNEDGKTKTLEKKNKGVPSKVVDSDLIEKKRKEWMEAKQKELVKEKEKEEKLAKEKEQEKIEQEVKRADASKVYNAWKEDKMRRLKARVEKEKERWKEKKEREAEEKKDAESAFQGWKRQKIELIKKKVEEEKKKKEKEEKEKNAVKVDENLNLEEAEAAYAAWLEDVELRREEEKRREEEGYEDEEAKWRPPWYPPGRAVYEYTY